MRAVVYDTHRGPITVRTVPDPTPAPDGVVLKVEANGICRSDWHAWAHGMVGILIFSASLPTTRLAVEALDPWFVTAARALIAGLLAELPRRALSRLEAPWPFAASLVLGESSRPEAVTRYRRMTEFFG